MNNFDNKIAVFIVALTDVYKPEDNRELSCLPPIEFKEESLTEDFTAMIYAQWGLYNSITGDYVDIVGFTHILNRLVLQKIMEEKGCE